MPIALLSDLSVSKMHCKQEKHSKEREDLSLVEVDRRHLVQTPVKTSVINLTTFTSLHLTSNKGEPLDI